MKKIIALLLALAMVGAGSDRALDSAVGGAGAAAVGHTGHKKCPPRYFVMGLPRIVCPGKFKNMQIK